MHDIACRKEMMDFCFGSCVFREIAKPIGRGRRGMCWHARHWGAMGKNGITQPVDFKWGATSSIATIPLFESVSCYQIRSRFGPWTKHRKQLLCQPCNIAEKRPARTKPERSKRDTNRSPLSRHPWRENCKEHQAFRGKLNWFFGKHMQY